MASKLSILILEDQPMYIDILSMRLLEDDVEAGITLVDARGSFLNALRNSKFDAIISDYVLPDINGKEALAFAKEISPDTPLIIFTGSVDEETAVECMKQGAADYVLKQQPTRLVPALLSAVEQARRKKELRESQASVQQALEWQNAIFEGSRDAVFISDGESRFVSVNKAACELTGFSRQELFAMRIPDLHDQPDLKAYTDFHERIMQGEEILSEAKIRRKDGSKVDTEFSNKRIVISGTSYMHTTARDVTERNIVEGELQKEEEILQKIFDEFPLMISFADRDGHLQLVNREWEKTLGWTLEELREQNTNAFVEFYPDPENRKGALEFVAQSSGRWVDFTMRTRDGRIIDVNWARFRLSDGTSVAIGRDVSERRRAELKIRESERQYEDIVTWSPVGIYKSSRDGRLLFVNESLVKMLGYASAEELLQCDMAKDVYFDNGERERLIAQYLPTGFASNVEVKWKKKDGTAVWIQMDAHVVKNMSVDETYFEGFVIDITNRKNVELELRSSHDRLRSLASRLHSIREDERTQISRELHDGLGQSLTGLKMDLSFLADAVNAAGNGKEPSAFLDKITSMTTLTDETIELVRRISAELRPVILDSLGLGPAIEWQASEFQKRTGIRCTYVVDDVDHSLGRAVSTAIFRIFQEALTNIFRHAKATNVDVVLKRCESTILLTIIDDGVGIVEGKITDGTSLGLLSMKERALMFGGNVAVQRGETSGTIVTLTIPIKPD